MMRIS